MAAGGCGELVVEPRTLGAVLSNFTFADVARGELINTGSFDQLTFIFVSGLPYEFSCVGIEAMSRI